MRYMSKNFLGASCDGGTCCPSWHKLKSNFQYIGTPYCSPLRNTDVINWSAGKVRIVFAVVFALVDQLLQINFVVKDHATYNDWMI